MRPTHEDLPCTRAVGVAYSGIAVREVKGHSAGMAETNSIPSAPVAAAGPAAAQSLFPNPAELLWALGDPVRWALVRELAPGQPLAVEQLVARLGRKPDLISKHLRLLREAGAVTASAVPDEDGRNKFYTVPAMFRRLDETGRPMVDYGVCALRFP